MSRCALSESELFVMKIVWKSEEKLSLQEIVERVNWFILKIGNLKPYLFF